MEYYSREELEEAGGLIDEKRDLLFNYAGLDLLLSRYVIRSRQNIPLESPSGDVSGDFAPPGDEGTKRPYEMG